MKEERKVVQLDDARGGAWTLPAEDAWDALNEILRLFRRDVQLARGGALDAVLTEAAAAVARARQAERVLRAALAEADAGRASYTLLLDAIREALGEGR